MTTKQAVLDLIRENMEVFFDSKEGYISDYLEPLGVSADSSQVMIFPNGKKYRIDLVEDKDVEDKDVEDKDVEDKNNTEENVPKSKEELEGVIQLLSEKLKRKQARVDKVTKQKSDFEQKLKNIFSEEKKKRENDERTEILERFPNLTREEKQKEIEKNIQKMFNTINSMGCTVYKLDCKKGKKWYTIDYHILPIGGKIKIDFDGNTYRGKNIKANIITDSIKEFIKENFSFIRSCHF